jgi:hypothetical protein
MRDRRDVPTRDTPTGSVAARPDTETPTYLAPENRVRYTDRPMRYFFYGLATGLLGSSLYLLASYLDDFAADAAGAGPAWVSILEPVGRIILFAGPAFFWLLALLVWGRERAKDRQYHR